MDCCGKHYDDGTVSGWKRPIKKLPQLFRLRGSRNFDGADERFDCVCNVRIQSLERRRLHCTATLAQTRWIRFAADDDLLDTMERNTLDGGDAVRPLLPNGD